MNKPINILVTGCNGRMGKAIINCASNHSEVLITKGIDIGDVLDDHIDDSDVVIDFSTHAFTTELVGKCASKDKSGMPRFTCCRSFSLLQYLAPATS